MEIVRLGVIDSTSDRARALLAGGKQPPFAVVAERQSAGRGRRGRTWQSPSGNLYVTFVLPPPALLAMDAALTPLKAAVCCAKVLQQRLGLRVTLKWPNDVLFAGKKIAGLLCETTTNGAAAGEVLIGLGLNTLSAPAIHEVDAPLPGALAEWYHEAIDHEALIHSFWEQWQRLDDCQLLQEFLAYATGYGQPWVGYQDSPKQHTAMRAIWTEAGLSECGELLLEPLAHTRQALRLASADHRCTWAYAARGRELWPLVMADCGNTRTKLALFLPASAVRPTQVWTLTGEPSSAEFLAVLQELRARLPSDGWPIFVASVNPEAQSRLQQMALAADLRAVALVKRRVRSHGERYDLAPLGIDRLAALEGALLLPMNSWRLIVSVGTATTIDALRPDGWHAGGWILPVIETGLMALHHAGRLLPEIHVRGGVGGPARLGADTQTAMLWGMIQMTVGAIARAAEVLRFEQPESGRPRIILTGGNATVLAPHLPEAEIEPWLVFEGIRAMVLGGMTAPLPGA